MSETITIPKNEYDSMKRELKTLRNTSLYRRLAEFEQNVKKDKVFTRKDLGF